MCVCSDAAGVAVARRCKRFTNHMKQVCGVNSQERTDLRDGKLVVRLVGPAGKAGEAADVEEERPPIDMWFHIGLQYLSPYELTLWRVQPVADPGEVPEGPSVSTW